MKGSVWPFCVNITSKISEYLPEYNRRILRFVCIKWRDCIKINKKKQLSDSIITNKLIKNDYASIIKWFIEDIGYIAIDNLRDCRLEIIQYGSIKCLRLYTSYFGVDFDVYHMMRSIDKINNIDAIICILEYYYPILYNSIENRLVTFAAFSNDSKYNKVMYYLMEYNIITESILTDISEKGFKFDTKTFIDNIMLNRFVINISRYFDLSPKFIHLIYTLLYTEKPYEWKAKIIEIINFTKIPSYHVCLIIGDDKHKEFEDICGCNKKIKKIKK